MRDGVTLSLLGFFLYISYTKFSALMFLYFFVHLEEINWVIAKIVRAA